MYEWTGLPLWHRLSAETEQYDFNQATLFFFPLHQETRKGRSDSFVGGHGSSNRQILEHDSALQTTTRGCATFKIPLDFVPPTLFAKMAPATIRLWPRSSYVSIGALGRQC